MATRRVLFALLAASLLLAVTPVSFADSHARIVRLSDIEGSVQIDRNTGHGFEKAIMNMPITQAVRLETGSSGRAEVEFENGSALRLADNTTVEFTDLTLRSNGDHATEVRVNDGTLYVNFKHKGGDEFRLDAGNQAINLDHDVHFRLHLAGNDAEIAVFKGELQVPHNGEVAKVKKGETLNIDLNNPAQVELAKRITGFGADEWDSERTDYNTQYAANYNRNQYPYQYGYSDLTYYGGFFDAPGYGTLWRPFGVSTMWDPFGDGAWAYYPGAGYMWVSSYPWGWMPYRYGRWVYVPTYGWAWQPGGWNTWNSYPVYVNAPATWHHPVPPPVTGATGSTVIVGNPVIGRPLRPAPSGAVHSSKTGGGANQPAAGATDRPGRSGRSSQGATFSKEAQPPSAINRSVRVEESGDHSANLPASKAQQVEIDRQARGARPAGTPAKAAPSTAPATAPVPRATPTPAPRPSMSPSPTTSPAPTPHPAPAPTPRPSAQPHSSMSSPGMPSGMHSMGMSSARSSSAGRPSHH